MSLKFKGPYIFSIVCCVFVAATICSCKKEKRVTISFEEVSSIVDDSVLVELNLLNAKGDKSLSEKINETINAKIIDGLQLDMDGEKPTTIDQAITDFKKEYAILNQNSEENKFLFEATFDTELLFEGEDILCIALTSYINTGGAHGNSYISLLNFTKNEAKQLANEALIKQNDKFSSIYRKYFIKNASKQFPNVTFSDDDEIAVPENIGFNNEGILFLFNNYELEFLGQEIFEFVIPSDELINHLNYDL